MAILTVLDAVDDADFTFLETMLGLSKGNLSTHLTRLEEAGLIAVTKSFRGRRPLTTAAITDRGRAARAEHWEQLERLRNLMA
ncbi:transcriptional regulator [Actinomycetota bacterium]